MTIEATLARIASALEALAGVSSDAAEASGTPTEKRGRGRPRKTPEVAPAPVEAPPVSPPDEDEFQPAKPSVEDDFGDPEPEAAAAPDKVYTADMVRDALVALQKRAAPEKARRILREVGGADTLKSLKPEKYRAVVEAAEKAA